MDREKMVDLLEDMKAVIDRCDNDIQAYAHAWDVVLDQGAAEEVTELMRDLLDCDSIEQMRHRVVSELHELTTPIEHYDNGWLIATEYTLRDGYQAHCCQHSDLAFAVKIGSGCPNQRFGCTFVASGEPTTSSIGHCRYCGSNELVNMPSGIYCDACCEQLWARASE